MIRSTIATAGRTSAQAAPHYAEHVSYKPAVQAAAGLDLGPGQLGPRERDYGYTGFYIGAGFRVAAVLLSVARCSDPDNDCSVAQSILLSPLGIGGHPPN